MNSLQLVCTLLTLQGEESENAESSRQLALNARRVAAVAQMHHHIRLRDSIESVSCKAYLERLCRDLSTLLRSSRRGEIAVEAVEAEFSPDRAV